MRVIPICFLLLVLTACPYIGGYPYNRGDLPDNPVNLEEFNSEYDDYNSTSPILGNLYPFCFSTNRLSQGGAFDVIFQPMSIVFDKNTGELEVTREYGPWGSRSEEIDVISTAITKIRSSSNELGPNLLIDTTITGFLFTLMYASDAGGDFDIYYSSDLNHADFSEPEPVLFLNSTHDDLYPAFNAERNRVWFCSNRENGSFDIYFAEIPNPDAPLDSILSGSGPYVIMKDTVLSGSSEDKCPFIFGNILVFASDREGGFGGFDLYYSVLEEGKWTIPFNFGPAVNTSADEYRPILIDEGVSEEEIMMIFSSDRPGGKGGFDLWFAGVKPEPQRN